MLLRGTALQETLSIRDNLQLTSNDQDRPNETFLARLLNKKDFRESIQPSIHLLTFNGPKYIKRKNYDSNENITHICAPFSTIVECHIMAHI